MSRLAAFAAPVLAIVMSGVAAGALGAVYRCAGAGGVPLYTDLPCKGGAVVDIRPGTADPAAIARLQRDVDRINSLAEARRAENDALDTYALDRESASAGDSGPYQDASRAQSMGDAVYVPIFVGPRPAFHRNHRHRHMQMRIEPRPFVTLRTAPRAQGVARTHDWSS